MGDEETNNVRVMVRVRLFNKREMEISAKKKELLRSCVKMRDKTCVIVEHTEDAQGFPIEKEREAFDFDECFWSLPMDQVPSANIYADQKYVYERSGYHAFQAAMAGYNVTIFAYGQTGSGKTYSMLGAPEDPGISPRLVDDLFAQELPPGVKMTVECMFFEIYNEKVRDLFNKGKKDFDNVKIRQHPTKGVFVDGLLRKETDNAKKTKELIERGTKERAMAETKMNAHSSRSHAVFQIMVTQKDALKGTQKVSTINLVDLAGSEKIKLSGVSGDALTEAKNINQSLSTLRKVIDVLIDNSKIKNKKHHKLPPFRESVLTYVLSDSLGGNSKTQMIATISPHEANIEDTMGTLRYALRAKSIVCEAKVNEEKSAAMMESMRDEIMLLQQKLREGKGAGGVSEEIEREIREREQEMQKMERDLQEAEQMKAEMEIKMKEVEEAKAELSLAVESQKKERFAAAFRNAFLISGEKKKAETQKLEFDSLRNERDELLNKNHFLNQELHNKTVMFDELKRTTDERIEELVTDLTHRDTLIAQQKRQLSNALEESKFVRETNDALKIKCEKLEQLRTELEKRVQRLQEELLVTNATVEREQADKERQQQQHEGKLAQLNEDLENLRKRKDRYKMMYMEAKAKSDATSTVIDALQGDRNSFITTIKAQQHVVEEQGAAVQRIFAERREAESKLRRLEKRVNEKEEDARLMSEALREYQSAASEWVYENHTMQREIERLQRSGVGGVGGAGDYHHGGAGSGSMSPSPSRTVRTSSPRPGAVSPMHQRHADPFRQTSSSYRRTTSVTSNSPRPL